MRQTIVDDMKPALIHLFRAALAVLVLASATGAAASPTFQDPADRNTVPLIVIDGVPLPDAIRNLARQAGLNYILDPRVPGSGSGRGRMAPKPMVTARWTNVTAKAALSSLLQEHKLTMFTIVTNPATTVVRIAPANLGLKPKPASQVGTDTNAVLPLIVMDDVPVSDAIRNLATHAGLNVSLDPKLSTPASDLQGTVSIRWENITVRQALAAILDNYDLVLEEEPGKGSARIRSKSQAEIAAPPKAEPGQSPK